MSLEMASLVWPLAMDSRYFPRRMNVMSIVLVSNMSLPKLCRRDAVKDEVDAREVRHVRPERDQHVHVRSAVLQALVRPDVEAPTDDKLHGRRQCPLHERRELHLVHDVHVQPREPEHVGKDHVDRERGHRVRQGRPEEGLVRFALRRRRRAPPPRPRRPRTTRARRSPRHRSHPRTRAARSRRDRSEPPRSLPEGARRSRPRRPRPPREARARPRPCTPRTSSHPREASPRERSASRTIVASNPASSTSRAKSSGTTVAPAWSSTTASPVVRETAARFTPGAAKRRLHRAGARPARHPLDPEPHPSERPARRLRAELR